MNLKAERDGEGRWIVRDELGHLVPMVQVFVCATQAERMAKLFAAAPEMLAVLEGLVPMLEEWALPTETKEHVWNAINKAKGAS